jgi:hypothetical protein
LNSVLVCISIAGLLFSEGTLSQNCKPRKVKHTYLCVRTFTHELSLTHYHHHHTTHTTKHNTYIRIPIGVKHFWNLADFLFCQPMVFQFSFQFLERYVARFVKVKAWKVSKIQSVLSVALQSEVGPSKDILENYKPIV